MNDAVQASHPPDESRLVRMQALSGLVFATFLALHLGNTLVAALGQAAYDSLLGVLRRYYQLPLVEVLAVGVAGVVHIGIGWRRALQRRRLRRALLAAGDAAPRIPIWLRVHRACGWFLVLVIAGHFAATRGPGLALGMPADFAYLNFSLVHWPILMYPYYALLFGCGTLHLVHGSAVALGVLGLRAPHPSARWLRLALTLGLLAGAAAILAMGGVLAGVDDVRFEEYRRFYEEYLPFLVTW